MKKLQSDINNAINLMEEKKFTYCKNYSSLILFSNENSESKNKVLKYKNKTVLSPVASGDQYLAAKYYGALKIDSFDINILSEYIKELKIAAIKVLTYDQFKLFLFPYVKNRKNIRFLSESLLLKLKLFLPYDVYFFWREIISFGKTRDFEGLIDIHHNDFREEEITTGSKFYSKERYYNILKKRLLHEKESNFIPGDLFKNSFDKEYDIIDLSNIMVDQILKEYYEEMKDFMLEELLDEVNLFADNLANVNLSKRGILLADYQIDIENKKPFDIFEGQSYTTHKVKSKRLNKTDLITTRKIK